MSFHVTRHVARGDLSSPGLEFRVSHCWPFRAESYNRALLPSIKSQHLASRQVQFGLELIFGEIPFPVRELIRSHSEQVRPKFGVVALLRPEVERDGCEFVDQGVGQSVLGEIRRLDIGVASVAAFNANVGKLSSGVDRKLGLVFLSARRTNDPSELPLTETETAKQVAAAPVALLAQNTEAGLAIAERAQRMGIAFELQPSVGADRFRVRLEKCDGEEFVGDVRRVVVTPGVVQQFRP